MTNKDNVTIEGWRFHTSQTTSHYFKIRSPFNTVVSACGMVFNKVNISDHDSGDHCQICEIMIDYHDIKGGDEPDK